MNVSAVKTQVIQTYDDVRRRWPFVDRCIQTSTYYGEVRGSQFAAGITYYAFLSFFPLIALAFALVGYAIDFLPGAEQAVTNALSELLPGMVGTNPGQIDVQSIAESRTSAGVIGLLGLLYTGLNWIAALRIAIDRVFGAIVKPKQNFFLAKGIDLLGVVVIGAGILITTSISTTVSSYASLVASWLGVSHVPAIDFILHLTAILVGVIISTPLFFLTYRLLPTQKLPSRPLWVGAFLASLGFEVLKQLASLVIGHVTDNVLYGTFAILVALLVWINYTSRLVVFGAAWAATAVLSVRQKADEYASAEAESDRVLSPAAEPLGDPGAEPLGDENPPPAKKPPRTRHPLKGAGAVLGAIGTGVIGWRLGSRRHRHPS